MRNRLGAAAAVLVLPLSLTACGGGDSKSGSDSPSETAGVTKKDDGKIQDAYANLLKSKSTSFAVSLSDPDGNLKKSLLEDSSSDPIKPETVDRILGGKITLSVDPTGTKTFQDIQGMDVQADPAAALKAVNLALKVEDKDGPIAELRIVEGVIFASVDIDKIDQIDKEAGGKGVGTSFDEQLSQLPGGTAIGPDLRAGKFLKLDLTPFIGQLAKLAGQTPTPSSTPAPDASKKLTDDLLAAVKPFTQITSQGKGDFDVEVEAKSALKAAAGVLSTSGLPGAKDLDLTEIDKLRDGKLKGAFSLDGDHLKEATLDLASIVAIAPADPKSPNLDGSKVKLAVNDSADGIGVPDKVSAVDLNSLLGFLLGSLGSRGGS
ncbi:MAG: hypothetical protein JWL64_2708 [Frankiales bacterium]|nr:hypothetical protein [Frankiales bacterium]